MELLDLTTMISESGSSPVVKHWPVNQEVVGIHHLAIEVFALQREVMARAIAALLR